MGTFDFKQKSMENVLILHFFTLYLRCSPAQFFKS